MITLPDNTPELINYWLECNGYTIVVGVNYPGIEITEDWHTTRNGYTECTTMCHMIYKSDQSPHITPQNFMDKLSFFKVFQ